MVEFSGIISDEVQENTMKKRNLHMFFVFLVADILLIAVTLALVLSLGGNWKYFLILIALLISTTLLPFFFTKKKLPFRWQYHITVNSEEVKCECPIWKNPIRKPLKKIKKVLDCGDCYYIIYAGIENCIVCQKDLIVEGTIEEFEKFFEGKIIRK